MNAFGIWERVLLALLVLLLAGFGLGLDGFMTPYALADSTFNFSEKGLLALAMALLIVAGEIDLSIAATMALSSLAMGLAMKAGAGLPLMVLAAFATGALAGALNGWLVTAYRLPSIVVTIGTLSLYRGIALVALGDQAITGYPEPLSVLGNGYLGDLIGMPWLIVPLEFIVFLLMAAAVGTLLHRTVVGRRVYAIGANPIASRFSGIEVDRYRFWLFVFAGVAAALAAVMLTGRIGSTRPNIALGWELDAVTMVILGGVAIEGGRGSIVGTVLAALLMGMFTFALGMVNVSGIVMSMLIGVLLVIAMVLPRLGLARWWRARTAAAGA
jgi:rhamnose transport system permease protein